MPELIDKGKLLYYLAVIKPDKYVSAYGEAAVDVINHVETYVNAMPTIEAEPVRHSVLIRTGNDFVCGKCAITHRGRREDIRYCMRCGCKFDLGVKTYPDDYCKDDDGSGVGQAFSPD